MLIDIEKSILVTMLEQDFVQCDERVRTFNIDYKVFLHKPHRTIARGIIRLKEMGKPVHTDILREQYMKVNKWDMELEATMLDIMIHNPFGTYELFNKYYTELLEHSKSELANDVLKGI